MKIEIRRVNHEMFPVSKETVGEELWIDGKRCCTYPGKLDGNQVAHSVCVALRQQGIDATYQWIDEYNPTKDAPKMNFSGSGAG